MTVLLVGSHLATRDQPLWEALERSGTDGVFVAAPDSVDEVLQHTLPRCVLTDSASATQQVNQVLRRHPDCSGVPLIALVEQMSGPTMVELHRLGADDIALLYDDPGLLRRLAALSQFDPQARSALSKGACLLAHPEPYRRQVLGRVLRQAGFDVSFAENSADAIEVAARVSPKILVVADRLPLLGGEKTLAALAGHWLGRMPAVMLSSSGRSRTQPQWHVLPADGPPDDLLFAINELLSPRELVDGRASRRLLLATLCAFRSAGELENRFGLTYNISREGLYVRTFDAPNRSAVWLEVRLPGAEQACHLRGEIVWTRSLATGARGAAPAGFGVRIDEGACPSMDLEVYRAHYDALAAARTGAVP